MKKPELRDFGLNENDKIKLDNQIKSFSLARKEYKKRVEKCAWVIMSIISISIGIFGGSYGVGYFFLGLFAGLVPGSMLVWQFFYGSCYHDSRDPCFFDKKRDQYVDIKLEQKLKEFQNKTYEYQHWLDLIDKDFWINLSGREFEQRVAEVFRNQGYQAMVTGGSGDGGIDIVLDNKIAVQCKHHKNKNATPTAIRDLQGVVANKGFEYGIFVSLNGFSATVKDYVKDSKIKIELLDMNDLIRMQKKLDPQMNVESIKPKKLPSTASNGITVKTGMYVKIRYIERNIETVLQVTSDGDADSSKNKISVSSPIGSTLLGQKENDVLTATTPSGKVKLQIIKVSNLEIGV